MKVSFNEMSSERDWIFARRFIVRHMIECGLPSAADHLPAIAEQGTLADALSDLCNAVEHDFAPHASRGKRTMEAIKRARALLGDEGDPS